VLAASERTRLFLFNKPKGLVTTNKDPQGRPTIFSVLPAEMPRVVTIGRLDINTEGLLLLTNDWRAYWSFLRPAGLGVTAFACTGRLINQRSTSFAAASL
jgi:16S rRNA U516 pseudouridylate synthase RsuA-like enzyme